LLAASAQLVWSAVVCVLARKPIVAEPLEAYDTVFAAVVVFGIMALAVELVRRRALEPVDTRVPIAYANAWSKLRSELLTKEYIATVALTFLVLPLCLSAFSAAKQAIPVLHPFTWDANLSTWGDVLDGGQPLWQRLQPALGKPPITVSLDWFYHRVWAALLMATLVWTALLRPSRIRRQYLFAFVLLFLVAGNLMALALASAGPAYFDSVASTVRDPYSTLMNYLRSVDASTPLTSVRGEDALWYASRHSVEAFGLGVSAMPSMHVASATLAALLGFALSRRLGVLLSAVALCTFAASVELGWHYTLDGYVGAAAAALVWWLAGRATRYSGE
jgi:PAP2 superfamily